ncbi:hypothetical protein [Bradyrhizobium sp. USDA 4473]
MITLEARTLVLELMTRSLLTMYVANSREPLGVIDQWSREFEDTLTNLVTFNGADEAQGAALRKSMLAIFEDNMAGIRARIVTDAQQEAAAASGMRN